jgi:hypothetical protein
MSKPRTPDDVADIPDPLWEIENRVFHLQCLADTLRTMSNSEDVPDMVGRALHGLASSIDDAVAAIGLAHGLLSENGSKPRLERGAKINRKWAAEAAAAAQAGDAA